MQKTLMGLGLRSLSYCEGRFVRGHLSVASIIDATHLSGTELPHIDLHNI